MSAEVKYQIGQKVWRATFDSSENYVTCPDCGGTGRIRVVFHDETVVSIECNRCQSGYDPPRGAIKVYDRAPRVKIVTISGFSVDRGRVEYKFDAFNGGYYSSDGDDLFATEEEATEYAKVKAAQADAEERAKIATKEKDTRTWAWNASYHRQCIKRAERDLEYHRAKLSVAAIKAKEPVAS